jgi:ABC-type Fe3+ transport system permease subunit
MENTVLEQKKIVEEKGVSLWRDAYYRLLKNKLAVFGALFIIFEVILALVTPWIAPYGFEDQNLELTLSMPSMAHWMGTDNLGRDIFTRILYGGRISMMVGFLASMVSVIVGVVYGAVSGYIGGKTDNVMMRIVDVIYAFHGLLEAPGYMDQTDYFFGDSRAEVAEDLIAAFFDGEKEYMDEDELEDLAWLESIVNEGGGEDETT